METQMAYPHQHDHNHEQYPHITGLHGEDGDQHDKKSVLKKVKAKAVKIKETIKSHGHRHNHDHDRDYPEGQVPDDHDLDEEGDEGDEIADDPEINGASGFEGAAIRSPVPGGTERSGDIGATKDFNDPRREQSDIGQSRVALGRTPNIEEVPIAPANTPAPLSFARIPEQRKGNDPIGGFVRYQEAGTDQPEVGLEVPMGLEGDPHAPKDRSEDNTPSNYQTKTIDPTAAGGDEVRNSPILASFQKMNIQHEPKQQTKENVSTGQEGQFSVFPSGSHDQFSPGPTPPEPIRNQDNPRTEHKTSENLSPHYQPPSQGSYTGKITSAITDKAISAKNVIASKLGYGDNSETSQGQSQGRSYPGKITSATSAIADKTISTKNVIASKLGYGDNSGTSDGQGGSPAGYGKKIAATVTEKLTTVYVKVAGAGSSPKSKVENPSGSTEGQKKGVSVKDYFADKLTPGEEDKALSEVISETLLKKKAGKAEEEQEEDGPTGRVTESEEVKRRLESIDEASGERADSDRSSVPTPGKGVVDKLKGAVGSWFAKGDAPLEQQESLGTPSSVQGSSIAVSGDEPVKRMLQESGN